MALYGYQHNPRRIDEEASAYLSTVDAFAEEGYDPYRHVRRNQDYKALAEKVMREFEADVDEVINRMPGL